MIHQSKNLIHHLRDETFKSNRWNLNRSKYFQTRFNLSSTLFSQNARGHSGCVNALDFSSDGLLLASGGDDKRVLIWNMSEVLFNETNRLPTVLGATHLSNIFSIKFDNQNRRIISAGNDEQILIHDIEKRHQIGNGNPSDELVDVFLESSPVNCLSIQAEHNDIFIAATEDGHVHLYDLRSASSSAAHDQPSLVIAESFDGSYHSCTFNPQQTNFVATANARQGIELYDIRLCKSSVLRYGAPLSSSRSTSNHNLNDTIEGMSVCFNYNGRLLYALRRRLPPVIFKFNQSRAFCQFDAENYVNLCTMKAGCFLGDQDQYIASGSDDFNVYIWRVPDDRDDTKTLQRQSTPLSHLSSDHFVWNAHMILRGHRSVVNQIRYSSRLHTIVSSGVEKIIKMWTPYQTRNHRNHHDMNTVNEHRPMYSHRDYLRAVLESGSVHHDSSIERYDEDKRMLAFFDSLLQRELSGRNDDDDDDDTDDDSDDLSSIVESSDDDDEMTSDDEEQMTLEEINRQTVDFAESTPLPSQSRHTTIATLAKNYRVHYLKKLKEIPGISHYSSEKRSLESPTMITSKRQCSTTNSDNTLQRLRNRIRDEENEQFFFDDIRQI